MNKLQYLQYLGKLGNQGGKKPTWTPARLSNLSLWLDAADASTITLNGSTVSQWNDKSGNGRNISQAVASQQPTWNATGLNGKPTIDFDGTNDFLKNATFEPAGAVSCFLVFNRDSNVGTVVITQRTGGIFEIGGAFDDNYRDISFTATGTISSSRGFDIINNGVNQDIMLVVQYDGSGTSATDFTARLNGASQAIVNSGPLGFFSETGFSIGARPVQNSNCYDGQISELIFTNSQSPLPDVQKIEGYLAWKWGLVHNLPVNHPYRWDGREFGYTFSGITDTDAQTYIAGVETADGQVLENATRTAIQNFIVGAKADGIWDAIKSSAILAGARTLSGALVPLKGTAPTNFNFVSGDYNRKTGLVGDGSTKYLDSNRAENADPQNSSHLSVYVSEADTGPNAYPRYISSGVLRNEIVNTEAWSRGAAVGGLPSVIGLNSLTRSSADGFTQRRNQASSFHSGGTQPVVSSAYALYRDSGSGGTQSSARLAFYSIGESLNLALLDARVTQLMTDLGNAIP